MVLPDVTSSGATRSGKFAPDFHQFWHIQNKIENDRSTVQDETHTVVEVVSASVSLPFSVFVGHVFIVVGVTGSLDALTRPGVVNEVVNFVVTGGVVEIGLQLAVDALLHLSKEQQSTPMQVLQKTKMVF